MKKWDKKYLIRFIAGMVTYAVLLPASLLLIRLEGIESTILKQLIALIPVAPFLVAMAALISTIGQMDELKQRIDLESILITALLTGGLSFSYGLLEISRLAPHLPTILIAPIMLTIWGFSKIIVERRYA